MTTSTQKVLPFLILVILVVVAGLLFITRGDGGAGDPLTPSPRPDSVFNVDPNEPPKEMTIEGEYVCLPHKDTSGPQTMECTFGLKVQDEYVGTDLGQLLGTDIDTKASIGDTVRVTGLYVPIEQLSNDYWQTYPIRGIIKATNVERL